MESFFIGVGIYLGVLIFICFYRIAFGPTVYDRVISVSFIGTMTVVLLVLMGFIFKRIDMFVDISLMYALLNFIGTLVFAKYFVKKKGAK
ncbi:MAG: monovalent cation/H+ antiporter complex subunit F [Candidatus Desulfofervidus auxilii]|mgnify:CR=1 FL=1|nr:monovalent cation/H+ antiporter complex subunit F [Candidatus Desulfofervidus auxilii]